MMRFLFGVLLGAAAYWAYEQGLMPFGKQDAFDQANDSSDSSNSPIIRPTAQEVSGRPAEPIPS